MEDFSQIQIELKNIDDDEVKLNYKFSTGIYELPLYHTELILETEGFKDGLIPFDPKYGLNEQLEFNFMPIFIAHQNPPAQVNFHT